jgi:hypothetical protein
MAGIKERLRCLKIAFVVGLVSSCMLAGLFLGNGPQVGAEASALSMSRAELAIISQPIRKHLTRVA